VYLFTLGKQEKKSDLIVNTKIITQE